MPQPGILDFQSLQAAADQLRASLLDHKNPKPPAVETAGANCSAIQASPAKIQLAWPCPVSSFKVTILTQKSAGRADANQAFIP